MTRGERNNNPGNLNYVPSIPYLGQLGIELVPMGEHFTPRFARFDTAENGIRALCVCLLAYYKRHGLDTVAGIITRWSPPSDDNATSAYINIVSKEMGIAPDAVILLSDHDTLVKLATAIIRHENGSVPYDAVTIGFAASMALAGTTLPTPPRAGPPTPKTPPPVIPRVAGIPGAQPVTANPATEQNQSVAPSIWTRIVARILGRTPA